MGSTIISSLLKISSLMRRARRDPIEEPIKAPAIQMRAGRSLMNPFRASRAVEMVVPMAELNLLVPRARWGGRPASR